MPAKSAAASAAAAMLLRPVLAEDVYHVLRLDRHRLRVERVRPAWVPFKHLVRDGVSKWIERDAVHAVRIARQFVIRNPVGFDELHVERHVRFERGVAGEEDERLPVLAAGHANGPQLGREVYLLRPHPEVVLYSPVGPLVLEEHLESWSRSYRVLREGLHDPPRVGVVLHFVAGARAQYLADVRIRLGVRREELRRAPVLRVVLRRLRRVEAGAEEPREKRGSALAAPLPGWPQPHSIPPPDAILVILIGSFLPFRAFLEARN